MAGWFGDLGRLYWGLLYWNARKTLFRIAGARGQAPCQHPSDSGAAGVTGCEACAAWSSRARFKRLCPLIASGPDGRRVCGVAAADVRPFWGRAAAVLGISAAALACAAVAAAFAGFRAVGYRVPLRAVAWPPAWHEVRQARADYYYRLAVHAFGSGDIRGSYLALNQAYALDPRNFAADRLLAQLSQIGNPDFSDSVYSRLVAEDLEHREDDGQLWVRALIERGDFPGVALLSARMLEGGARHGSAWAQALLFAERMTGDPTAVDRLIATNRSFPEGVSSALALAVSLRGADTASQAALVRLHMGTATSAFDVYYSLVRLNELGSWSEVASLAEGPSGTALDPYDREAVKLDAYASLGWDVLVRREIASLVERGPGSTVASLVAAHLVRCPDPGTAEYAFQQLDLHPLAAAPESSGARLALLCAAGVNGLGERMRQQGEAEGRIVGGSFPAWLRVRDFFEGGTRGANPSAILPAVGSVPLDTLYAVYDHYRAANPGFWRTPKAAPN